MNWWHSCFYLDLVIAHWEREREVSQNCFTATYDTTLHIPHQLYSMSSLACAKPSTYLFAEKGSGQMQCNNLLCWLSTLFTTYHKMSAVPPTLYGETEPAIPMHLTSPGVVGIGKGSGYTELPCVYRNISNHTLSAPIPCQQQHPNNNLSYLFLLAFKIHRLLTSRHTHTHTHQIDRGTSEVTKLIVRKENWLLIGKFYKNKQQGIDSMWIMARGIVAVVRYTTKIKKRAATSFSLTIQPCLI